MRWSEWSRQGVRGIQMGSDAQLVLGAAATDRSNIDWGFLHLAVQLPRQQAMHSASAASAAAPVGLRAGSAAQSRLAFIASGALPNVTDGRQPRRCSDDLASLSVVVDLGAVDGAGASHLVLMGYDDVRSVEYFGARV